MRDDFFIERSKRTGHFSMPRSHFHDHYEIYYLLRGERNYFIKDTTYRIAAGDIVFIGKYELHKTSDAGSPEHERILINFDDRFLRQLDQPVLFEPFRGNVPYASLDREERERTERLLFDMLAEAQSDMPGAATMLQAQLASLLIRCARLSMREARPAREQASPLHRKMTEIVEYVNAHYRTPLSLETVARTHYISPYHLSRTFKKITGFAFVEYVNSVRIKSAQAMLRDTNWKVTRIAEEAGFDNISHFGRVFKQIAHCSPLEYRRNYSKPG